MISSSIRCRLAGAHVGWTTKQSQPRTFSLDLDVHLAVAERPDVRLAHLDVEVLRQPRRGSGSALP